MRIPHFFKGETQRVVTPDQECPSLPPAFVTISVDDGHVSDLVTAEALCKSSLKATFYIPKNNPERPVMEPPQIREIASMFEVGGHTISHRPLTDLREEEAWNEIRGCKEWLQDLLGRPAVSFCYPKGKYSKKLSNLVRKAAFLGARTCHFNLNSVPQDPFLAGVSTHAFPHSVAIQVRHAVNEHNWMGLFNFLDVSRMATDWEIHFRRALDWVEIHGGVAHLYLHSWEVEQRNEWEKLTRVLREAASRKRILPITNGDLFDRVARKK
jgi:peptidoglycan-N-acetylglucosamine deacetylase